MMSRAKPILVSLVIKTKWKNGIRSIFLKARQKVEELIEKLWHEKKF